MEFFKRNLSTLKGMDFSLTEGNSNNITQLNNILQSVVKYIENPSASKVIFALRISVLIPTVAPAPAVPIVYSNCSNKHYF